MSSRKPSNRQHDATLIWTWALAAVVVLFTVIVRIRLLGTPLERDEGEFAYMGQLMLKGIPPYELAYNMKLPGTYAIYALIMTVFGQTIPAIRLGLLLANLSATALVFLVGRRLWSTQTGLIAAAGFVVLSLGRNVSGISAHATQFVVPLVLAGILLLLKALDRDRPGLLFWSGVLLGLGFIAKQHAVAFAVFGGCYLLWQLARAKSLSLAAISTRIGLYTAGVLLPFGATCLLMYKAGVFDKFWFWTFTYAREYASELSISDGVEVFLDLAVPGIAAPMLLMLILSGAGTVALICDRKQRTHAAFLIGLLLFSFLAVCPGFYFRGHYWVQMLPAICLLVGIAVPWMSQLLSRFRYAALLQAVPILLFAAALVHTTAHSKDLFFAESPIHASRVLYMANPFPESVEVARYIKEHTKPTDRIAVFGSEPQIYFYADRISATGHIYMYGLMEPQPFAERMQQEMIREIEAAKPKFMVYVSCPQSWMVRPNSYTLVTDWAPEYCDRFYKVVGFADTISEDRTEYTWGEKAKTIAPSTPFFIVIYERRD